MVTTVHWVIIHQSMELYFYNVLEANLFTACSKKAV